MRDKPTVALFAFLAFLPTACIVQTEPLVGETGPPGETGDPGLQGDAGPQGPSGTSPWIQNGNGDVYYTTGRVGIGTTSPSAALRVSSNIGDFHGVLIDHIDAADNNLSSNDYVGVTFRSDGSGAASWAQLSFAGSVTQSAYAIDAGRVNGGQGNPANLLLNPGGGWVGIGQGTTGMAATAPEVPLHVSACAEPQFTIQRSGCAGAAKWSFGSNGFTGLTITDDTGFSSGAGLKRLTIDPSGRVGIGTTSPDELLTIAQGHLKLTGNFGISDAPLKVNIAHTGTYDYGSNLTEIHMGEGEDSNSDGAISYFYDPVRRIDIAHGPTIVASFTSNGQLGIGTTTPIATLDVNGTARLAKYPAPPFACDLGHDGILALTSKYVTCVCNGSTWVKTSDGTTACTVWQ